MAQRRSEDAMTEGGMGGLTASFAGLIAAWPADDPVLLDRCRLLLLDGVAVAVGGAAEDGPRLVARLAQESGGAAVATLIGQGFAGTVVQAARVNGMAMHVLDYEPMWNPPNHALSPLLPALLALAEMRERAGGGPQGRAVLRAIAKGVEAQGRLRLSSGQFEPAKLSMHPPGAVGPVAAALACADLLALDCATMATACSIAASRCGGVLANVGSMTKALHCGDAAANGVEAAMLAAAGFGADPDALGSPRGWGAALFGAGFDPAPLLAPIGRGRALEPGPAWKLFPSQFATHFAITAALDAHAALDGRQDAIELVEIIAPAMPYIDRPRPATGLDGKFSWQYATTVALLDGRVDPASFTDARRFAPDAEDLLARTRLIADAGISGRFDAMHTDLRVHLRDGTVIRHTCRAPLGSWSSPVPPDRIVAKAGGLLAERLPLDSVRHLLDTLTGREDFGVQPLMAALA